MHRFLSIWMCAFNSLGCVPRVGLLGHMVNLHLTFEELLDYFPKRLHYFTFPLACSYIFEWLKKNQKEKNISCHMKII